MPGPAKDFVRGGVNNRPFRPGGLVGSPSERSLPEGAKNGDWVHEIIDGGVAQSLPPSFKKGLDLGCLKVSIFSLTIYPVGLTQSTKMVTLSFMF